MSKTLTVYLAADTARFRRELRQADDSINSLGGRAGGLAATMRNTVGPAMLGVGAAAGAMAIAVGVDAVKAFMDDERAAAGLATTLRNLGLGEATTAVEGFIDAQQRMTGVTDEQLRPSMDRLLRSTKDVAEAQDLLKLALDVSAGSGKSLETVTNALARAADGNTGSLSRLGIGLDKATLKTKDFDDVVRIMAGTFEGQAAAASDTLLGKVDKLSVAFDELKESFGRGFIKGLENAAGGMEGLQGNIQGLEKPAQDLGTWLGVTALTGIKQFTAAALQMGQVIEAIKAGNLTEAMRLLAAETSSFLNDFSTASFGGGDGLLSAANAQAAAFEDARRKSTLYREEIDKGSDSQNRLGVSVRETNTAMQNQAARTSDLAGRLQEAAGRVEDYNRQITEFRNNLTSQIMAGVDLGAAFTQQGTEGGVSLLDAFTAQLTNAEGFATVLEKMKQSGASQTLIDQIAAMGPDIGKKLGQQMLDQGLVAKISEKFEATRLKIYETTSTLIPDFLLIGQKSAVATMDGLAEKVEKNEKRLRQIGEDIGEPIGAEMKRKITEAANAAIAAAQAAARAAPVTFGGQTAPGSGSASTTAASVTSGSTTTNRATASLLNNVLTQNNYRGGVVSNGITIFA